MQVTTKTWNQHEQVHVRMPLDAWGTSEVYLWLMFNVGVAGKAWEESKLNCPPSELDFYFKDPRHATLFALKWGHLIVASTDK